jgi:hypothetical protein
MKICLLWCLFLLLDTVPSLAGNCQFHGKENNSDNASTSFATPSGNIYCALVGEEENMLRCEIRSMLNPLPPQPYPGYCEFDWGAGFLLPRQGKPEILCISDTIGGSNYTLPYGKTWENAGFKCLSQKAGLKCTNSSGRGFFLSREKWIVF